MRLMWILVYFFVLIQAQSTPAIDESWDTAPVAPSFRCWCVQDVPDAWFFWQPKGFTI
jgi:hypothetical protein